MNKQICFPALVIKGTEINKISYKYLISDKRYLNIAYKDVLIVDQLGNCFELSGVKQTGGISLIYSIKLIGFIVKVEPILKKTIYQISLDEFRTKIIDILENSSNKFSNFGGKEWLINQVKKANSYEQIIQVF